MDASTQSQSGSGSQTGMLIFGWLIVGAPLLWGVAQTIKRALALFH